MNKHTVWTKPSRFDRNLVVIGAGSAGLVSAYIGAAIKAKVTLVERHRMGGDCLNTGCVPSKALIRSAKLFSHMRRSREFGIRTADAAFDFAEVMERVQQVIRAIEPHDSIARYTGLGVEVPRATPASFRRGVSRSRPPAAGRLTTRSIIIATGASFVPPIPGIEEVGYLSSDDVWAARTAAQDGGARCGPIGCELTQTFARFGAEVTQVDDAAPDAARGSEVRRSSPNASVPKA